MRKCGVTNATSSDDAGATVGVVVPSGPRSRSLKVVNSSANAAAAITSAAAIVTTRGMVERERRSVDVGTWARRSWISGQ